MQLLFARLMKKVIVIIQLFFNLLSFIIQKKIKASVMYSMMATLKLCASTKIFKKPLASPRIRVIVVST